MQTGRTDRARVGDGVITGDASRALLLLRNMQP